MTESSPKASRSRATGPRTLQGRARVAQNARKHGLTRASPDTHAITALVESWLEDPDMQAVPRVVLWRFAQERTQIARAVAHQAAILDQLIGRPDSVSDLGQSGDPITLPVHDTSLKDFALSMRYRAEAESRGRTALRDIIRTLNAEAAREGDADGAP